MREGIAESKEMRIIDFNRTAVFAGIIILRKRRTGGGRLQRLGLHGLRGKTVIAGIAVIERVRIILFYVAANAAGVVVNRVMQTISRVFYRFGFGISHGIRMGGKGSDGVGKGMRSVAFHSAAVFAGIIILRGCNTGSSRGESCGRSRFGGIGMVAENTISVNINHFTAIGTQHSCLPLHKAIFPLELIQKNRRGVIAVSE